MFLTKYQASLALCVITERTLKSKITIALLILLIACYIGLKLLSYFFEGMDYQVVSSKGSENKKFIVTELLSMSEGGHAPYGTQLILSGEAVNSSKQGHTIFAGYCKKVSYHWVSNSELSVSCKESEKDAIKSLSSKAFGVEVKLQNDT